MSGNQQIPLNWRPILANECHSFYLQPKSARISFCATLADQISKPSPKATIVTPEALMTWFPSNLRTILNSYRFDFFTQFLMELSNVVDRIPATGRDVFEKSRSSQLFSSQAVFF
jgi:hypothetical protein